MEERLLGSGAWVVWRTALVVTICVDFAGVSCLRLSPSCSGCRPGRVASRWFVITPVTSFELDGSLKAIFRSLVNIVFCGKGCRLSRFIVTVCVSIAVVGGKLRFLSRRLFHYWHCIFHTSVFFLGANYRNLFQDCSSVGSGFCSWGWLSSFLRKTRWFRSWSWELLLTRHCNNCLVQNKGGCSFGLFNCGSYVLFRANRVIWGIFRSDGRAGVFAIFDTMPCSLPWGTDNQE